MEKEKKVKSKKLQKEFDINKGLGYPGTIEDYYEEFHGPVDKGYKAGGMTKAQKKVGSVMKEFKAGKLHSGKKGPVVKNPKQAIAIALSESGQSKKMMGGMMSDGVSKKGMGIEKKMGGGMMSDGVSRKGMGVEKRMGGGMMSDGISKKGSGIEMKSKGGMVRGQGAAIRGTKFKGIF